MTTRSTSRAVHLGQFRLTRLQVVNWGTFCGYKDFRIDDRGVLLTGPSGSGKSSLMDAHSMALLPTYDQRFNASADLTARGSKQSTRSVADYVRGAWSETNDENERSKVRYLRGGQPTWSAVGATYDNGLGAVTTAVVVKWFTGVENDGAALSTLHQLHEGHFDLQELNAWAERKFDTRWLKQRAHPEAQYPGTQELYMRELAKRIGLGSSRTALALLGKAKAMKNVGDLNLFIRDHMLDRPGTFEDAQKMLAAFTPLNDAYETAKRADAQEQVLREVPDNWRIYKESERTVDRASTLRGPTLDRYVRSLLLTAIEAELAQVDAEVVELDELIGDQETQRDEAEKRYLNLKQELSQKNQNLEAMEQRQQTLEERARTAEERYSHYSGHVTRLEEPCPQDEAAFTALRGRLPDLNAAAAAEAADLEPRTNQAIGEEYAARKAYEEKYSELIRLQSAKTLIPGKAVLRREQISQGTGVPITSLPYAAELIDIADGQERWRPAAEKVLRNYGMRLLVPERHKDTVRQYIDSHDMRSLIEYSIVTPVSAHEPRPLMNTLAGKLTVAGEHQHGRWLASQLAQRFNHVCVETARDLDDHRIAVTVNGTVKLPGNQYRKDDRPELTDRASYILGANTAAKRKALEQEVAALAEIKKTAASIAGKLSGQLDQAKGRVGAAKQASEYANWASLDYWSLSHNARELGERIEEIRAGDVDLQRLEALCSTTKEEFTKAFGIWQATSTRIADATKRETHLADLQLAEQEKPHTVADDDRDYLDDILKTLEVPAVVDTISDVRKRLDAALIASGESAQNERKVAHEKIRGAIVRFLDRWRDTAPDDSGDVDRSGQDFAHLHTDIVQRRLPEAMVRFEKIISEDMVPSIAVLQRSIETAASEIESRVAMVNAGLRRVEFNAGTHLQISYTPNQSADAKEFRRSVDKLMSNAAGIKNEPEKSVDQFKRVKALMTKFTATEAAAERWKKNVLDVRNGYTFYGREIDDEGTRHTYRNTASNSGGEQEKLVAFCLAAALSYNLADSGSQGRPHFGALMLDEAFSKSDENFSAQALSAFDAFGFQLLIAAPIRMSGIVEPYIGQAILVEKRTYPDGTRSTGKSATFGELADRRFAEGDGEARASA